MAAAWQSAIGNGECGSETSCVIPEVGEGALVWWGAGKGKL